MMWIMFAKCMMNGIQDTLAKVNKVVHNILFILVKRSVCREDYAVDWKSVSKMFG